MLSIKHLKIKQNAQCLATSAHFNCDNSFRRISLYLYYGGFQMIKKSLFLLTALGLTLQLSACGKSGQLLGDLPTDPSEVGNQTPTNGDPDKGPAPVEPQNLTCKNPDAPVAGLVTIDDNCISGTHKIDEANTAFFSGDFPLSNCIASKIFNESVKVDPLKSDTTAAYIAFWSRAFLMIETEEVKYLLLDTEFNAIDIFGPNGDEEKFSNVMSAKVKDILKDVPPEVINAMNGDEKDFAALIKGHLEKGHSTNDIVDKIAATFNRYGKDFHTLLYAMSHDYKMDIVIDFPNKNLSINEKDKDKKKFNNTIAAVFDTYLSLGQLVSNLATYYHTGISGYESFTSTEKLYHDIINDTKLLALRGSADATSLLPLVYQFSEALNHGLIQIQYKKFWMTGLVPNDLIVANQNKNDETFMMIVFTNLQLKDSLTDQMIPVLVAEEEISLNLFQVLKNLPDFTKYQNPMFSLKDGDIDFNDKLGDELETHLDKFPFIQVNKK